MANQNVSPPPRRKEPGIIGSLFSFILELLSWFIISLIFSILVEWVGMVYFWPEQGLKHAESVFEADLSYLNHQFINETYEFQNKVISLAKLAVDKIENVSWVKRINNAVPSPPKNSIDSVQLWMHELLNKYSDYFQATKYVFKTFIIRLVLVVFSLPIFIVAIFVGVVDGLVERDLRRWGGGRESSNVFNLAKKSIIPAFGIACVIYISLPFSINPAVIILPFSMLQFVAVRITTEKLKKYF